MVISVEFSGSDILSQWNVGFAVLYQSLVSVRWLKRSYCAKHKNMAVLARVASVFVFFFLFASTVSPRRTSRKTQENACYAGYNSTDSRPPENSTWFTGIKLSAYSDLDSQSASPCKSMRINAELMVVAFNMR